MSEDQVYKDGDIVWVKLGNNWWPGEVIDAHRHPDGMVNNIKRKLYCIVKFFNENAYEYVSNLKQIYPFQCAKKEEFLKKGFSLYKSGNKFMEKFPEDVEVAERLTRHKVPSLFINDRPDSIVKAILGQPLVLTCDDEYRGSSEYREKRRSSESITKIINITPNKTTATPPTAAAPIRNEQDKTAASSSNATKCNFNNISISSRASFCDSSGRNSTSAASNTNNYRCNLCEFTSVRQNVMILHRKMHSNRNGPPTVPTTNRLTTTHNSNNNVSTIDSNTKVNRSVVTKTPSTTITAANTTPVSVPKIPTKVVSHETIESTNSSKKASPITLVAESCTSSEIHTAPAVVPNETQSRRSMRHMKIATLTSRATAYDNGDGSTTSIDLPETKPIKKIPKKRDFANLNLQQLQHEYEIPPVAQEVQIAATAVPVIITPPPATSSAAAKGNAEEIRNMLLADWSDEDETAEHYHDRNEKDCVTATAENNDRNNDSFNRRISLSPDHGITSTPSITSKSLNTARIRNIPKKDRRDVILQDFGSDLSMIESGKESPPQGLVVHLDSSNSSAVEIVEELQPPIITIKDDEDEAKDKAEMMDSTKKKKKDAKTTTPARQSDLENVEPNDKLIVASILSCFDFQDDEDEDDIDTPTAVATSIAHFKKKYLSTEKSQTQIPNDSGSVGDINRAAKEKHEERAQKDQELTAEIESLLEQTQPPASDLLTSTNSFEECLSVKDLPIKERGKRIFKSRNRSRIETKSSTESLTNSISTDDSLTKDFSANATNNTPAKEKRGSTDNQTKAVDNIDQRKSSKDGSKSVSDGIVAEPLKEQPAPECKEHHLQNGKAANKENSTNVIKEIASQEKEKNISDYAPNNEVLFKAHEGDVSHDDNKNQDHNKEIEITPDLKESSSVEEIEVVNSLEKPQSPEPQELETANMEVVLSQEIIDGPQLRDIPAKSPVLEIDEIPIEETILTTDVVSNKPEEKSIEVNNENINLNSVKETESPVTTNIKAADEEQDISKHYEEVVSPKEIEEGDKTKGGTIELVSETIIVALSGEANGKHVEDMAEKSHPPNSSVMPEAEHAPLEEHTSNRLINPSPTDENSSMGASDTGAEFGSPASMLSEERLPTFPFNRTETPQQEIEATEKMAITKTVTDIVDTNTNSAEYSKSSKALGTDEEEVSGNAESNVETNLNAAPTNENSFEDTSKVTPTEEMEYSVPATRQTENSSPYSHSGKAHNRKKRHMKNTPRRNVKKAGDVLPSTNVATKDDTTENVSSKPDAESSMLESQEENGNQLDNTKDGLPKYQTRASRTIKTPVSKKHIPIDFAEQILAKSPVEETIANHEITTNDDTLSQDPVCEIVVTTEAVENRKEESNSVEIGTQSLETCSEVVENPEDAAVVKSQKEKGPDKSYDQDTKAVQEDNIDANERTKDEKIRPKESENNIEKDNGGEKISPEESSDKKQDTNDITAKDKCTEKCGPHEANANEESNNVIIASEAINKETLLKETTASKENINVIIDAPSESENTNQKRKEQTENGISIENQSNLDVTTIEQTSVDRDIKENDGAITSTKSKRRATTKTPKKRSGELILVAKEKQRKHNETAANEHDSDSTSTAGKENLNSSTTKSSPIDFEEPNQNDPNTECNVKDPITTSPKETAAEIKKSTKDVNQTLPSELQTMTQFTKKSNEDNSGHNLAIPLSPGIAPPTPQETEIIIGECESSKAPYTAQQKDLIIESETQVPVETHIIDFDNMAPSPRPQGSEVVVESETAKSQAKEITVEEEIVTPASNIQVNIIIDETDMAATLVAFEKDDGAGTTQPTTSKEEYTKNSDSVKDIPTVSNPAETDADKATHDFLIEFDNLVNQATKETMDEFNAEDIINNIIVEVQEDNLKQTETNFPTTTIATAPVDTDGQSTTATSQRPFYRQTTPIKRRQTVCFDLSEGIASGSSRKRQIFDFEDALPAPLNAHKRTATRKMTMPDIDRPNSDAESPFDFAKQFKAFTPRRRSSIEENIASFLIHRPNASKDDEELFPELFDNSSTSSTGPTYKQLGVDSRGNKYVLIKNPPSQETNKPAAKAANGRNMKRKGRRMSMQSESKLPRDATGCVAIQPKIPKTDAMATTLNDNQISTAQQQLIQLQQQQPQIQSSSSIILNKNTNRARKTHKSSAAVAVPGQPQQQQQQSNQLVVQQIQLQQLQQQQQQQQLQQQLITQLANQQNVLQFVTQPATQQHIQQVQQTNEGFIITTATPSEDDNVIDSNTQLIALPTQPYPGYTETFLLCKVKGNTCKPVDNVPLYLNHQLNELVPIPSDVLERGPKLSVNDSSIDGKQNNTQHQLELAETNKAIVQQISIPENVITDGLDGSTVTIDSETIIHQEYLQESVDAGAEGGEATADLTTNNGILLNIEGQQVLLDAATFAHLLANPEDTNTQLISDDGTEYVLTHEVLQALHMQQQQEQQQQQQQQQQQVLEIANAGVNNDIIAVAMAGSDLYGNGVLTIDTSQAVQLIDGSGGSVVFQQPTAPTMVQQHLTPPAVVTNAVLDQSPIMSALEVPSSNRIQVPHCIAVPSLPIVTPSSVVLGGSARTNLDDSLAAIGVTAQTSAISSSLGLPITVTDPNIANKVTSAGPLNEILQFVSHRPATAQATAAAVAAAALAGESRIFND